ncbi:MAG: disulfide bond formation protein DsbA [Xanthobacter sp. 17-67-6]|nr:MAG: disulfide bond formation protein DsbA [Rhizobiales bacterium 12-68-15]OYX83111.1 MAG: disulfide bond formation protein DsbA [Azorhizobium sp. 32-67-21]OYY12364.1 MAG: disulfide bond formation protein DsbA [Rhizobiales bacterium 35-68-8]OYZ92080.1 MAG: disulfide bond formation protein DsbA [Xanthobacter sp. 17-67-6]
MLLSRRRLLLGAGQLALFAAVAGPLSRLGGLDGILISPAAAQAVAADKLFAPAASPLPEQALGDPKAPVTIVEYASLTCSHCAAFHAQTFPTLKSKYIDTGKVRFILREFPFDPVATAGFMLARCLPSDKYFPMVSSLFDTQRAWAFGNNPAQGLLTVAKQAGMSEADFEKCLSDKELADKVQASAQYANKELGVDSTPTFFINGKKMAGAISVADLDKELAPLLQGK